jgi:DNA polymerase III subunit gamma/tau
MALNCASNGSRPCGSCAECLKQRFGQSSTTKEFNAEVLKGKSCVKMMKNACTSPVSKYRVYIIDECHTLSSGSWNDFMKSIEDVPRNVVFILSTSSLDQIPDVVISRCQKFIFSKINESEIMNRLKLIASQEGLEIGVDALSLISSTCDGSLRDAETILDQLSLLGHKISLSMVQELVSYVILKCWFCNCQLS